MRRTVTRRLLQGPDICLFCAFRHVLEPSTARSLRPQRRLFNAATVSRRPAAAAALRVDEDEDSFSAPTRELLGWKCGCTHVNKPARSACSICLSAKPQSPVMVYNDLKPPAPRPPPLSAPARQSPSPAIPPPSTDTLPRISPHARSEPASLLSLLGERGRTAQERPRQDARPNYQSGFRRQQYDPPRNPPPRNVDEFSRQESQPTQQYTSRARNSFDPLRQDPQAAQQYTPRNRNIPSPVGQMPVAVMNKSDICPPRQPEPDAQQRQPWQGFSDPGDNRRQAAQTAPRDMVASDESGFRIRKHQIKASESGEQPPQWRYQDRQRSQGFEFRSRYDNREDRSYGGGRAFQQDRSEMQRPQNDYRSQGDGTKPEPPPPRAWSPMARAAQPPPPRQPPARDLERDRGRWGTERGDTLRRPDRSYRQGQITTSQPRYGMQSTRHVERQQSSAEPSLTEDSASFDGGVEVGDGFASPASGEGQTWSRKKALDIERSDRRSRLYAGENDGDQMQATPAYTPRARQSRSQATRGNSQDYVIDEELMEQFGEGGRRRRKKGQKQVAKQPSVPEIVLPEFISVEKLAQSLKVRLPVFLKKLAAEGFEDARHDHVLDSETSAMFAEIYGFEPIIKAIDDSADIFPLPPAEDPSILPPRPPIVTIMGHVDHGKTTILDYFRKANVVASEHGGITQHIGAFSVTMPGSERNITFLDTPGHAAFLEMRRRGAVVTDIVVLVVAADDSVKAQTIEAIKHAKESGVQIIVAINKIDKPGADIDKVKLDLIQHDIVVEDHGGDFQAIPVSGKTGQGMDDLEEAILALADVADFRAETDGQAEGWVIESRVGESGRVATVLVRRGTLRVGDFIVAGSTWARIRTLRNDASQLIDEAPPGTPIQIDGWRGDDPEAGLEVLQAPNEQSAKDAIAIRKEREQLTWQMDNMETFNATRAEEAAARAKVIEWEKEQGYTSMALARRPKDNEGWVEKASAGPKLVPFLVKADVAGSTEALVDAVSTIGNGEIGVNIIHSGTGGLTESDVKMLAATGETAYAINFNQPIDVEIRQLAVATGVNILDHNIIYKVTDDVTEKVTAQLPAIMSQRVLGEAEIGDIFEIKVKKGVVKIAGCRINNGIVKRSEKIRVLRRGEAIYTGTLNSFKNQKKDITEMRKGSECGMGFDNWDDFEVGDQIQCFEEITEKRTL